MSDLPELEFAQRVEGSLAVVPHPQEPDIYGLGNLEVEGTLRINDVKSNKDDVIILHDPLDISIVSRTGQHPIVAGTIRVFADEQSGKLATADSTGKVTVLNPLTELGDIMVYGIDGPQRLPKGNIGQVLTIDASGYVTWSSNTTETIGSVYGSNFTYKEDKLEKIATNTVFVSHLQTSVEGEGMYCFRVEFDWNMVDASSTFEAQVVMNENTMVKDTWHVHQVDEYRHFSWSSILTKSADTALTFFLQMRCVTSKSAYKCKNLYMEVYRVA